MRIFKCAFTGDEIFSDIYPHKHIDGVVYEVTLSMIEKADPLDSSITEQVLDLVDSYSLWEIAMKKSEFKAYFKSFIRRVQARVAEESPERVDTFKASVLAQFQRILGIWKDVQLFIGSSNDMEKGTIGVLYWEEETPRMIFFSDALVARKV